MTILGSENCQSILIRTCSVPVKLFKVCDLTPSTEAVKQLQSLYQTTAPHITCHSCHYVQTKHSPGYKVKVQSENISACHDDGLTGLWNSLWFNVISATRGGWGSNFQTKSIT